MSLATLFGLIYVVWGLAAVYSLVQLSRFLAETPRIADHSSLERFKSLARVQMFLALGVIALLTAGIIVGMVLVLRHGLPGLVLVLAVNIVLIGFSQYLKRFELRARNLQAGSEALGSEYRRIAETWVKKPWPDF